MTRQRYQYIIRQLVANLVRQYPHLDFQNHCYRRIAYDNALGQKWTEQYQVFTAECTKVEMEAVIDKLERYKENQSVLLAENTASLRWRGKS
ncbi:MAG: hypothetical protein AAF960_04190 [Bacteroidota bacterium]